MTGIKQNNSEGNDSENEIYPEIDRGRIASGKISDQMIYQANQYDSNSKHNKNNSDGSLDIEEIKMEDNYDIAVPKSTLNKDKKKSRLNVEDSGPKTFMQRKQTLKYLDEGYQEQISPEDMMKSVNQYHPRMYTENGPEKIPLGENVGWLSSNSEDINNIDKLGKAVSIYFKLLKSLIVLFLFFSVMATPMYVIYSAGEVDLN